MHKSTSILDLFKRNGRPLSGGSFAAYGMLLCYVGLMLCYSAIDYIQTVSSYMMELGWVEIA